MENSHPTIDEIFAYIADSRRRYLLRVLAQQERCTVGELTAYIAKREADESEQEYIDHRRYIAISLVHNHLPRLANDALIEYNHSRKEVVRTDRFDAIQPVLENMYDIIAPI